jgi:cellulose synthase (UDP-forming)
MEQTKAYPQTTERLRHLLAIIAVVITGYYLYWRVTETFNPNAMFFSWALYGAEVFGAITTFLFYFVVWKPLKREAPPPIQDLTVDVLIPTKSESVDLLRKTLLACNDLKYSHRTLVLDDGNRQEVKALCDELNCIYLAREKHEHAKAGNLNFGLQHSTAEYIAVFDADHVPLPHFIDRLIGYFRDEKVGFVQAPQEFYNIDSFQHRTDPKKKTIWGEQYLFFSLIQPGRDYWDAAYFVGSCTIIRRKALDDIGGFATASITEDMLTSIRLHAKGWSSVYHNENLAYGIAAETLKPFHIQRQRWGVGSWQVFVKANPLLLRGLTLRQSLCYLSSMIYPLEGIQKIVFYLTPPIALFTGILPMRALDLNYLMHFIPYFVVSTLGFNEMARGFGGQIMLEQFSMGKFFTYLKTLVIPFLPRKSKEFKVTPKWHQGHAPFTLVIPQMLILLGSLVAICWALLELLIGRRNDSFIVAVNCFWALYNSSLALAIINYDYRKLMQRRERFRMPDTLPVLLQSGNGKQSQPVLAVADDITEDGMSILAIGQTHTGQFIDIDVMLPDAVIALHGNIVQERSIMTGNHRVSLLGVHFENIPQETRDLLSRYLHESVVTKYMKEYSTRYKTYLEMRFMSRKYFHKRAYRAIAYLPLIVHTVPQKESYAVMKDISDTGMLLASRTLISPGNQVIIDVMLGEEKVVLKGTVVRDIPYGSQNHPEYLIGVRFDTALKEQIRHLLSIADKIGSFIFP